MTINSLKSFGVRPDMPVPSNQQVRLECLRMANHQGGSPEMVARAAKAYEEFVTGTKPIDPIVAEFILADPGPDKEPWEGPFDVGDTEPPEPPVPHAIDKAMIDALEELFREVRDDPDCDAPPLEQEVSIIFAARRVLQEYESTTVVWLDKSTRELVLSLYMTLAQIKLDLMSFDRDSIFRNLEDVCSLYQDLKQKGAA
jgi:hypothetical protein